MRDTDSFAVEVRDLHRRYGRHDALRGLDLTVERGRCHGFFGRNGAGKTTTLKCLINHLRPDRGTVRVCGLDPQEDEVAVKARIGYVPDEVAFYPWMTVRGVLDYAASFRPRWNEELERELLDRRFQLDERASVEALSRGMRAQLALLCAVCPEPELLLLDEPTSGLDPVVRREFLETVIGAYQDGGGADRTVLVSTHLIGEFEGLIDSFTLIEDGRATVALDSDEARRRYKRVHLLFDRDPPAIEVPEVVRGERQGRELELVVRDFSAQLKDRLRAFDPTTVRISELSLEEIFVANSRPARS